MKNAKPLSDLELYELIIAAYPDKFDEYSEDDPWDDVMEFVDEQFGDIEIVSELLGRVVMLTSPLGSALSGQMHHCLGKVEIKDGQSYMMAAVSRRVNIEETAQ